MRNLRGSFIRIYLNGKLEGILGELYWRVGEGEVAVQAQPRVVEPEPHERQQEVHLNMIKKSIKKIT